VHVPSEGGKDNDFVKAGMRKHKDTDTHTHTKIRIKNKKW